MIYGYENENIRLDQISDLYKDGMFEGVKIKRYYRMPLLQRGENGRLRLPTYEEDAEEQLIHDVVVGDIVVTSTLVNFSGKITVAVRIVKLLVDKGVRVVSVLDGFDTATDDGKAFLQAMPIMQKYGQLSHMANLTKQREGIAKARSEGKYDNAKKKEYTTADFENFDTLYQDYIAGVITKMMFATKLGISRPTLDKLLKQQGGQ